jgi:hypothetical protein
VDGDPHEAVLVTAGLSRVSVVTPDEESGFSQTGSPGH